MTHKQSIRLAIFWTLVVLSLMVQLLSCSPSKKAHEYFAAHNKEFAQDCADAFPVVPIIDSNAYKQSLLKIDSLAGETESLNFAIDQERQWSNAEIKRLKSIAPPDCDSLQNAQSRLTAEERARGDSFEVRYKQLQAAVKNIKPVVNTVVDNAKVEACKQNEKRLQDALTNALIELSEVTADRNDWKNKAQKRMWSLIAVIIACTAITFRKPILSLIKSIL